MVLIGMIMDKILSLTKSKMIFLEFSWFFLNLIRPSLVVWSSTTMVKNESRSCFSIIFNTLSFHVLKFDVPSSRSSNQMDIDVMNVILCSTLQDLRRLSLLHKTKLFHALFFDTMLMFEKNWRSLNLKKKLSINLSTYVSHKSTTYEYIIHMWIS